MSLKSGRDKNGAQYIAAGYREPSEAAGVSVTDELDLTGSKCVRLTLLWWAR